MVNGVLPNGARHLLHWIPNNVFGYPVTMLFIKPSLIILCDLYDEHAIIFVDIWRKFSGDLIGVQICVNQPCRIQTVRIPITEMFNRFVELLIILSRTVQVVGDKVDHFNSILSLMRYRGEYGRYAAAQSKAEIQ